MDGGRSLIGGLPTSSRIYFCCLTGPRSVAATTSGAERNVNARYQAELSRRTDHVQHSPAQEFEAK